MIEDLHLEIGKYNDYMCNQQPLGSTRTISCFELYIINERNTRSYSRKKSKLIIGWNNYGLIIIIYIHTPNNRPGCLFVFCFCKSSPYKFHHKRILLQWFSLRAQVGWIEWMENLNHLVDKTIYTDGNTTMG